MILQSVHNIADNTLGIFFKTELLAILAKVGKRNLGGLVTDGSLFVKLKHADASAVKHLNL
jgi:hypothetical protein